MTRGREAQWRPCRLDARRLKDAADWIEPYRCLWEARFDRLESYLQEPQRKRKKHGRKRRNA